MKNLPFLFLLLYTSLLFLFGYIDGFKTRSNEIESKWGVDLSAISAEDTSTKRWDFVVKTNSTIYVIETNFYGSGGSKLNETARSYKMIAEESRQVSGVEFIWITDGSEWKSARRNLEETFNTMNHLYNISEMEEGILEQLF